MLQLSGHFLSVSYESELTKSFKLEGEIPRKTMLRHLLLLGMPFISHQVLNDGLMNLGYLPLTEGHTMITGEYLDVLLLFFLSLYEESCRGGNLWSAWSGCVPIFAYWMEFSSRWEHRIFALCILKR
ncbi:MAG: hypothetical protein K2K74_12845 [Lachnospiraceae bacterium]|nr:hypothetical protein [Lachnospiraceae bacterium]